MLNKRPRLFTQQAWQLTLHFYNGQAIDLLKTLAVLSTAKIFCYDRWKLRFMQSGQKWIREGIQTEQFEMAIQAYMQRKTSLSGGAAMAEIPYPEFLHELESLHIIVLENEHFLDELEFLANAFNNRDLCEAVQKVREEAREFEMM